MDIIVFVIIGFIVLLFFASWMYGHNLITTTLIESTPSTIPGVNISEAAEDTFGVANSSLGGLRSLAFIIIFGMALSIIMSNFLIKAHPAFFIVYIFVIVIAIVLSVFVSNTYETLMTSNTLGTTLSSFTAGSFIMLQLPVVTAVVGVFGAIFLFIGIIRDDGLGGGVI